MIKVAGLWELGWNTPIKEIDLWEMVLREFRVDEFYMAPITGIRSKVVREKESITRILEENKDVTKVFVDERATTYLPEFEHPKNVLYIFGKTNFSPILSYKKPEDLAICVSTPANQGLMWPHQICAVVLYDRMRKWQSK